MAALTHPTPAPAATGRCAVKAPPHLLCSIRDQRVLTDRWRLRAGSRPLRLGEPWLAQRRGLVLYHWQQRRLRARAYYHGIWAWYAVSGAACIHTHEGSWMAATSNGYWGGFQMTLAFQAAHGWRYLQHYGTANLWPPTIQVRVTRSVVRADGGWYQWGTRGLCGL